MHSICTKHSTLCPFIISGEVSLSTGHDVNRERPTSLFDFFFIELCCLCTAFVNCTLFCTLVWIFYTKFIVNDIKD